jgi:hypothetical protein
MSATIIQDLGEGEQLENTFVMKEHGKTYYTKFKKKN